MQYKRCKSCNLNDKESLLPTWVVLPWMLSILHLWIDTREIEIKWFRSCQTKLSLISSIITCGCYSFNFTQKKLRLNHSMHTTILKPASKPIMSWGMPAKSLKGYVCLLISSSSKKKKTTFYQMGKVTNTTLTGINKHPPIEKKWLIEWHLHFYSFKSTKVAPLQTNWLIKTTSNSFQLFPCEKKK
jgi:hypothetical protein